MLPTNVRLCKITKGNNKVMGIIISDGAFHVGLEVSKEIHLGIKADATFYF